MKHFFRPRYFPVALIIAGVMLFLVSLAADDLGLGSATRGLGWKQWLGVASGLVLLALGFSLEPHARQLTVSIADRLWTSSLRCNPSIVLAVCLGAFWFAFIYHSGIQFSSDSTKYMTSAARIYYASDFSVPPTWPPLYPLLMSLVITITRLPAEAAAALSGISMLLLLVTFGLILRRLGASNLLTGLFVLVMFTLSGFLYVFEYAWSETVFALFVALNLYFVLKHIETSSMRAFVLAATFAALASLTRYIGIGLLLAFTAYTLYCVFQTRFRSRRLLLLWSSLTYIPIGLYLLRNYLVSRTLLAPRADAELTFFVNLAQTLDVLGNDLNLFLQVLLVSAMVLYSFAVLKKRTVSKSLFLSYIVVVVSIYLILLWYSATNVQIDPISSRYFGPVYPLFFLFIYAGHSGLLSTNDEGRPPQFGRFVPTYLFYGFVLAVLIVNLHAFGRLMDGIARKEYNISSHLGAGFNLSTTVEEFGRFLGDELAHQDNLHITVVYGSGSNPLKPHLGRSFFFRRGILRESGLSFLDFQFGDVELGESGYVLLSRLERAEKALIYHDLPTVESGQQLVQELEGVLAELEQGALWLILYNDERFTIGTETSALLPERFQVVAQRDVAPYTAFQLEAKEGSEGRLGLVLSLLEGNKKVNDDGTLSLPWNTELRSPPLHLAPGEYSVELVTKGTELKGENALFRVFFGEDNLIGEFYSEESYLPTGLDLHVPTATTASLIVVYANDDSILDAEGNRIADRNAYIQSIEILRVE